MKKGIADIFPLSWRRMVLELAEYRDLEEIRIRRDKPLMVRIGSQDYFIDSMGNRNKQNENAYVIQKEDIDEILEKSCQFSTYAYEEEFCQGYIALPGGHRLGVVGEVVMEQGRIRTMKNFSGLNLRIAKELSGVAEPLMEYLYESGFPLSTLIVSPPGNGKTTLLRDCIRLFSNGTKWGGGINVSVIDERRELAGYYQGQANVNLGIRTDVLDGCPKNEGMSMVLRAMNPTVVAMDEIGGEKEFLYIRRLSYAGVQILASMHGEEGSLRMWETSYEIQKIFQRFIFIHRESSGNRFYMIWNNLGKVIGEVKG